MGRSFGSFTIQTLATMAVSRESAWLISPTEACRTARLPRHESPAHFLVFTVPSLLKAGFSGFSVTCNGAPYGV